MSNARTHDDLATVIRRSLAHREQRRRQRRRRSLALALTGLIAASSSVGLFVASRAGADIAAAATNGARSLSELIAGRSPGARTEAQLTKTRRATRMLPERGSPAAPDVSSPEKIAQLFAPSAEAALVDIVPAPELAFIAPPSPPGAIFLPPPVGGGIGPPAGVPGGGGGSPPATTPSRPPLTILTPPAVPEPATWTMMILGFGLIGWRLRRRSNPARHAHGRRAA